MRTFRKNGLCDRARFPHFSQGRAVESSFAIPPAIPQEPELVTYRVWPQAHFTLFRFRQFVGTIGDASGLERSGARTSYL